MPCGCVTCGPRRGLSFIWGRQCLSMWHVLSPRPPLSISHCCVSPARRVARKCMFSLNALALEHPSLLATPTFPLSPPSRPRHHRGECCARRELQVETASDSVVMPSCSSARGRFPAAPGGRREADGWGQVPRTVGRLPRSPVQAEAWLPP